MSKDRETILTNRSSGFRAGGLIVKNNKLLVIRQILGDEEFYTIPGGTWETGETLEETCRREVLEEFGIDVEVKKLVFLLDTKQRLAFYFACTTSETEIELGGPEKERMTDYEQYHVEWLDLDELEQKIFLPEIVKVGIISYLSNNDQPTFFLSSNT